MIWPIHELSKWSIGNQVFLLDTFTGITTNLSQTNYVFTSDVGQYDGRFLVTFNSEVLDTQEQQLAALSIYPNPTTDILNVVSPQAEIEQVTVYDMMGRVVLEVTASNERNVQLDLSSMNSALYFIEISTTQGVITKRVIKK